MLSASSNSPSLAVQYFLIVMQYRRFAILLAFVTRRGDAEMPLPEATATAVLPAMSLKNPLAVVGRTVIDENDLIVAAGLPLKASDELPKPLAAVIDWNDDGEHSPFLIWIVPVQETDIVKRVEKSSAEKARLEVRDDAEL